MQAAIRRPAASQRGLATRSPADAVAHGWITGLSLVIGLLASVATTVGIATFSNQQHLHVISMRGEPVTLQGAGLYAHESVSMAAQAVGQDVVTLLIWIPLLLVATFLAVRGSLRGQILRTGILWYFAYTYLIYAFGAAYNPLFLLYVALFSASLFAFVLSVMAIDVGRLPTRFSSAFRRRSVASLMILLGAILLMLWLGRIVPALLATTPPVGLETYTTLPVQAADLGIAVPAALLAGVLLFQRRALGYVLGSVLLVYGAAFGLALIGMVIAMSLTGTQVAIAEVIGFSVLAALFVAGTVHLVASLGPSPSSGHPGELAWNPGVPKMRGPSALWRRRNQR